MTVSPPGWPGEIGEHIEEFDSPNAQACHAGKARVIRRPGKREYFVACRPAGTHHLREAVRQWAFSFLTRSGWARQYYDRHNADHYSHHAARTANRNKAIAAHSRAA